MNVQSAAKAAVVRGAQQQKELAVGFVSWHRYGSDSCSSDGGTSGGTAVPHLGCGVDGELQLGLLAVVHRQTFHQQGGEAGARSAPEAVEHQEPLQPRALVRLRENDKGLTLVRLRGEDSKGLTPDRRHMYSWGAQQRRQSKHKVHKLCWSVLQIVMLASGMQFLTGGREASVSFVSPPPPPSHPVDKHPDQTHTRPATLLTDTRPATLLTAIQTSHPVDRHPDQPPC